MEADAPLTLDVQNLPFVNYAMVHNDVPLVQRVRVSGGARDLRGVTIEASASPGFAQPAKLAVGDVRAGEGVELAPVDIRLDPAWLAQLVEAEVGTLTLDAIDADGTSVARADLRLNILPFNHWPGLGALPEVVAAFVEPNHPVVRELVSETAAVLQSRGQGAAINGYQSQEANRVRTMVSALYEAIRARDIAYCVPPASFHTSGQKIRTPDEIMEYHLSTCLDQAVLFAACMEAMGLNPLVVFTTGHAFAGVWLENARFPDRWRDDPTDLTKRYADGQDGILLVETTGPMRGQTAPFEAACASGEAHLARREDFNGVVDVRTCRLSGIRPLPLRERHGETMVITLDETTGAATEETARDASAPVDLGAGASSTRLDQWMRRLLDITARNSLISFRSTKSTLGLDVPDVSLLEDALADGREFRIDPSLADWTDADPRDRTLYQRRSGTDPIVADLTRDFDSGILHGAMKAPQIDATLTTLYRAARVSLEENGANTLFLAVGMLVWYESDVSEKPRQAPIILVPVELVRQSVQGGYRLRKADEDPEINITLLEMLRQTFGMEIPMSSLPSDDSGADVPGVLKAIRNAVMGRKRWDVLDAAALGLFSFSKFMMWKDLKARSEDLARNKVVSSLMAGQQNWSETSGLVGAGTLDATYRPGDLLCPMSADSSQLAAVATAGLRRTFVLDGPPGTGKSQTITNMIAHALAQGKRVLFVAEKMAALSVVQRRLAEVGLGEFCLELHSNKSEKRAVLAQLKATLDLAGSSAPVDWAAEAARLGQLRDALNGYVDALHRRRGIGMSVHDALGRFERVRDAAACVGFTPEQVAAATDETLRTWEQRIEEMRVAGEAVGHPAGHALLGSCIDVSPPGFGDEVGEAIKAARAALAPLEKAARAAAELLAIDGSALNWATVAVLEDVCRALAAMPPMSAQLFTVKEWPAARDALGVWVAAGRHRADVRGEIGARYTDGVLGLALADLSRDLASADAAWFLPRWLGRRRVRCELRRCAQAGAALPDDLAGELARIDRYQKADAALHMAGDRARDLVGRICEDDAADWGAVEAASRWADHLRDTTSTLAGADMARWQALQTRWSEVVDLYRQQGPNGPVGAVITGMGAAAGAFQAAWDGVAETLRLDDDARAQEPDAPGCFAVIERRLAAWDGARPDLARWAAYVRARIAAEAVGLRPAIAAYEAGNPRMMGSELQRACDRSFYRVWLNAEVAADPALCNFTREVHEGNVRRFRELDQQLESLTRRFIRAKLAAQVPSGDGQDAAPASERGVLYKELQRQRGLMALRKLFQKLPSLLPRLKPCLLMSPLSVAQYLDPAQPPFDLVIFDEASQVPTCEAVGAIARAAEAIIVGDPKQLPPTTFFQTRETEEPEGDEALQDLESILDDCLGLGMQRESLKWHYRSRHESLIAFSNYTYYENRLLTFPSPDDQSPRVTLRRVAGVYDRSKSRTNRIEAEALVKEIVRRLSDPVLARQTVGVVTFSQAQQRLIEDLLDERRRSNPGLERFFVGYEPLFVKNLENVQGDERDVILFSIGYGPDASGRVSMNFGPLNAQGGGRRLNVAVSRARCEMVVFASFGSDQIDLSRTTSAAVANLRDFLEYAEKGRSALYRRVTETGAPESAFEEQVKERLERAGFTVHSQVGCSGYRIDLALVHPDAPGRYVLGIECDGASYHSAKTARDRDKLRQVVLEGLGWTIHRIWSTDWWLDPEAAVKAVRRAFDEVVAKPIAPPPPSGPPPPGPPPPGPPPHGAPPTGRPSPGPPPPTRPSRKVPYVAATLPARNDPEGFYHQRNLSLIVAQAHEVAEGEGPIGWDALCKRVISAWGIGRTTDRSKDYLRDACRRNALKASMEDDGTVFIWPASQSPAQYDRYRVGPDGQQPRDAGDIAREEIASAMREVLREQFSMPAADLTRVTARELGYQRAGEKVQAAMERGLAHLKGRGAVTVDTEGRCHLAQP